MHRTDETHPAGEGSGRQIRARWAQTARGWAAGDADRFAACFAEDRDSTTVRGDKPSGRDGIEAGHDGLFRGPYAGTVLDARVVEARFPAPRPGHGRGGADGHRTRR
ncbi:SgcJ/EcaC family oxidoreductase [Streptomyces sp. NBC_00199]|uniref:SgcJ/EcaC family oxidoreductase n=1 Tax=Streptomyces sp. NBC_00199 TaxID=2975678 RepID=UPI0022553E63|nr:SgcJ/EcaC family oxidoreductase [Streptomyces sp. NBC_00199]MCX5264775.1 SgcJ/EcaC family oxidoreductase [Streptomyces sp. NBC_00199]